MKHIIFAIIMALFILYGGQNWHHYSAALMIAAWVKHGGSMRKSLW